MSTVVLQSGEETKVDTASNIHALEEPGEFCADLQSSAAVAAAGGDVTEDIPLLHRCIHWWLCHLGQIQQNQ